MNIIAVTTFNADGHELYGKRMIATFQQHWCGDVQLLTYYEGWLPQEDLFRKVRYNDLIKSSDWLAAFKRRHVNRNRNYGFRHDAVRFSHKVAALLHAAETEPSLDYIIWLDGDIVTHNDFTDADLKLFLPGEDELVSWLNRSTNTYPELGFYILNCKHEQYKDFLTMFRRMYAKDQLFNLQEWHDGWVMHEVVKNLSAKFKSLSGPLGVKTNHPLVNGPLAKWFDHLKGHRKKMGKTPKTDIIKHRNEPYWAEKTIEAQ